MSRIPQLKLSSPKISANFEKLIRSSLVLFRASEQKIAQAGKIYIEEFMKDDKRYCNTIVDTFLTEVKADAVKLRADLNFRIVNLIDIKQKLAYCKSDDKKYLLQYHYLPLRHKIETIFADLVTSKYDVVPEQVIWDTAKRAARTEEELTELIIESITRTLCLRYNEHLNKTAPYHKQFRDCTDPPTTLRKILLGLLDYECFRLRYEKEGSVNHMSSLGERLEKIFGLPAGNEKVQLTRHLWKLYVGIISAEKLSGLVAGLIRKITSTRRRSEELHPARKAGVQAELGVPLSPSNRDPGIYLNYVRTSIGEIRSNFDLTKLNNLLEDGVLIQLQYVESYYEICKEICEAIEDIISMVGCKDAIYDRFSSVKSNYLGQRRALEAILN